MRKGDSLIISGAILVLAGAASLGAVDLREGPGVPGLFFVIWTFVGVVFLITGFIKNKE